MLRHAADRRTLLWFAAMNVLAASHYVWPQLAPWALPLSLYFGFCYGVFAHSHNHSPTFVSRRANNIYGVWLSTLYGYPVCAWIPTHNQNHHKFINRPGDATITWRYSKQNTWLIASTYFFVSAYWQSEPLKEYFRKAKKDNPAQFRQIVAQYTFTFGTHIALLALALYMFGWARGLLVYLCAYGLPSGFALWSMIFINYIQHVHCDAWSKRNHSRNFTSKLGNFLVFNSGYHTVHHDMPGLHWSKLAAAHAKIAHEVHPVLNQNSIFGFCFKAYLLGFLWPSKFRTKQIGRAAWDTDERVHTARVEAYEAGQNDSIAFAEV